MRRSLRHHRAAEPMGRRSGQAVGQLTGLVRNEIRVAARSTPTGRIGVGSLPARNDVRQQLCEDVKRKRQRVISAIRAACRTSQLDKNRAPLTTPVCSRKRLR
jgi:hypothetical protein